MEFSFLFRFAWLKYKSIRLDFVYISFRMKDFFPQIPGPVYPDSKPQFKL